MIKMAILATGKAKLATLGVAALTVAGITSGTMLSMALFTDTETDDNTFTAGTIVLDATKIDSLSLTTSALMPGDAVRSPVTVDNDGTAQLRYAVSQTSTNPDTKDLRSVLNLAIRTADTGSGTDFATDGDYCDDATGTSLRTAAAMGASGNLVGDPTQGDNLGDRTLAAAASEILCFYLTLPISTADAYQGATTVTTFTFAAEQTSNNP